MVSTKKREPQPLKKGQAKFQLIGEAKITDFTFDMDKESKTSDWIYHRLNLGINCGKGNVVYADMMGGYGSDRDNVLYVHGKKENEKGKMVDDWSNRFEIDWDDRFDKDILGTIGDNCFIKVGIEKDDKGKIFTKRFLSQYDAIKYIEEHLEDGLIVNVKGDLKYNIYNDVLQTKKEITSIFLSKIDNPEKYRATFAQTVLLTKDSIGKIDKEKAIYPIDAYVVDYVGKIDGEKIGKNVAFEKIFELEVDTKNPNKTKKFLDKILKVKKDIVEVVLEGNIVEGQTLTVITEDDLPDDIKELVEMGAYTLEDAINKLVVGGNKEKRMIIKRPQIKMIGESDEKTPVIMIDRDKYIEDDLVFLYQLTNSSEKEETYNDEIEDDEEDEGLDWIKELDDKEIPF